jgi:hypothetical protein
MDSLAYVLVEVILPSMPFLLTKIRTCKFFILVSGNRLFALHAGLFHIAAPLINSRSLAKSANKPRPRHRPASLLLAISQREDEQ